eukprot:431881-Amorphochlora_amoeboformis.AAC.1
MSEIGPTVSPAQQPMGATALAIGQTGAMATDHREATATKIDLEGWTTGLDRHGGQIRCPCVKGGSLRARSRHTCACTPDIRLA